MKKITCIITLIVLTTQLFAQNNYLPAGINLSQAGAWKLVFAEEFNGNSIDQTKWVTFQNHCWDTRSKECLNKRASYEPNSTKLYPSIYMDDNVVVSGGTCKLVLKKENTPISYEGKSFSFSGGMIAIPYFDDERASTFKRGRFVARIKMCGTHHAHSTFWVYGTGNWDPINLENREREIDIAEYYGNTPKRMTYSIHNQPAPIQQTDFTRERNVGINWSKEWHDYMVDWDINFITYYIDNTPIGKFPRLKDMSSGSSYFGTTTTAGNYIIDRGFHDVDESGYIIISLGLDNPKSGQPKMYVDAASTEIDYVRVYQRDECTDEYNITNSYLFPFERLSAKSITLGTQGNINSWYNIVPDFSVGKWPKLEGGLYQAEVITMLPNFESKAIVNHNNHTPAFVYEARGCAPQMSEFPNEPGQEIDTIPTVDTSQNDPCDNIDSVYVRNYLDSLLIIGDTLEFNNTLDDLDSLGCSMFRSLYTTYMYKKIDDQGIKSRNGSLQGYGQNSKAVLNKLSITPNPTTGQLNITMPAQGDYEIKITNMLGVVVYQGKLKDEQQKQIQLENNLPSGNYTVQITGKEVNHIEKITLTR